MRQSCDTTYDKLATGLATGRLGRVIGKSNLMSLPDRRNGVLFDNSLNDKPFRIDIRVENGYEKGCTWGSHKIEATPHR